MDKEIIQIKTQNNNEDCNSDDSYTCSECQSNIEILSINNESNEIEFKCPVHGKLYLSINEYLEKMKKNTYLFFNCSNCKKSQKEFNGIFKYCLDCKKVFCNLCVKSHINNNEEHRIINTNEINNKCASHNINNELKCYCTNCKEHLCKECLRTRIHINHVKNNIEEIEPMKEELDIVDKIIKKYKKDVENLENEEKLKIKNLGEKKEIRYNDALNSYNEINKSDSKNKENEIKDVRKKYLKKIEEINKDFNESLKVLEEQKKKKLEENEKNSDLQNKNIEDKYKKLSNDRTDSLEKELKKIENQYENDVNKLGYKDKIEKMNDLINLNKIIYETYKLNDKNYFFNLNINYLIAHYINHCQNDLKEIFGNKYDEILKKVSKKTFQYDDEQGFIAPNNENVNHKFNNNVNNNINYNIIPNNLTPNFNINYDNVQNNNKNNNYNNLVLPDKQKKLLQKFRKEYDLRINDYSDEMLVNCLSKHDWDFMEAFDSLFE